MDFKKLKIGYVPYLPDLSQPADRRRFPYFAKRNNVPYEIADKNNVYDIILLTASSNLSKWLIYKKKHPGTRFVFEMVDSLIFDLNTFNILFKGVGRYLIKKENDLYPYYKSLLVKWLKIADVVICSSTELQKIISQWNANIIVSLDYLQNETKFLKEDYAIKGKMKLAWEGQSVVLSQLLAYKDLFKRINSFCDLHIITDMQYPVYGGIYKKDSETITRQLPITTIFHEWQLYNNYAELSKCDCGIIPLDKKNSVAWHKPANKLISFFFTGLPTIVSNTPAYTELMNKMGENFYCSNTEEWVEKIQQIKRMSSQERKSLAEINLSYVQTHYSDAALDEIWYKVFTNKCLY